MFNLWVYTPSLWAGLLIKNKGVKVMLQKINNTKKGINTAGQVLHQTPAAFSAASRRVLIPFFGFARLLMSWQTRLRRSLSLSISTVFIIILISVFVSGCVKESVSRVDLSDKKSPFKSFRDIPGVTEQEIAAVEALQKDHDSFVYGMILSTESFIKENNDTGGYAALFCEWLTGLFDIKFDLKLFLWTELHDKLINGEIDFSGHMMPDAESLKTYYMTDYIAEWQFITIRLKGSHGLHEIQAERPLRYAFIDKSQTEPTVAAIANPGTYEPIWVNDYEEAYNVLVNGSADAFITTSVTEAYFGNYDDLILEDFFPLIFNPVSLATAKPELQPVISVVTKALRSGAVPYLNDLYSKGYDEYKRYKFFMSLNHEEKEYLRNIVTVPLAVQYYNYPMTFYNAHEKKWDGFIFDLLREIKKITGLNFDIVNDHNTEMYDLLQMLSTGKAHVFSNLIFSPERESHYIWGNHKFMSDQFALLSKINFPNININEIPFARIALIKDTAYTEMFRAWFPNAINTTEYKTHDEAFLAMEHGKVDMVMSAKMNLLYYSNYYEFSGYKANYLFSHIYEPAFSFNKEQTVLCSVMDKALSIIDTKVIVEQWTTKTYDYHAKMVEAQRPWLIGAITMSFVVIALILIMLYRNRNEGKRLEKLVVQRTNEILEADERMEKLLKEMGTLILITDIETDNIIFVNERIKKDFNFSDNIIGEKCWRVLYENESCVERCSFCPKYNSDLLEGKTITWERFIPATNRYYNITSKYIDWPGGSRVYLQLYDDITEIKESIIKMHETDEYTQLLLDATPLSCTLWNRDLKMVNCNLEALTLFEAEDKEDFFQHHMERAPEFQPNGERSVEAGFSRIRETFDSGYLRFEWLYQLPGGELLPSEVTLVRVKYKNDFLVAGYIRDLREYKKYIAEINASIENLHEANAYTEILLDATPMGCSIWDKNLKIINCNKETLTLFEIKEKKQFIENFYKFSPEFQPSGGSSYELSLERIGKAFSEGYCCTEWMHQTLSGEPVPCELVLVRVKYKNDYLISAHIRDLREQKAILAEVNKAREDAEIANKTKSIFLANMSHEIRTQMNSIIGFLELAQDENLPSKTREYLDKISVNAKWLLQIINDILDISKIESGRIELEHIPFRLHEIFSHCYSLIVPKAEEKGLSISFDAEPFTGKIPLGDPIRLRHALINLLSNAVKFTSSGKVKLLVSVVKFGMNNITLNFEVKDSGIGINSEQILRIFEPFMQADESITRKYGGTGLGLFITKNIIEMMGGKLEVESTPGVGSRFWFKLTFDVLDETSDMSIYDVILTELQKPNFEGEILICEDNDMNQQVICDHLARVGLKTIVANNGKEGVDFVKKRIQNNEKPFDLIFMDIHMPVMDGLEAASIIMGLEINTPIVVMTANIMTNDMKLYKTYGINDFVSKPFTSQELWKCLLKYFRPVTLSLIDERQQASKDEEMQNYLKANFIKSNQTIFAEIRKASENGDIKLAHRLAHTLKSNAGQIGKKKLQEAAKAVEVLLAKGKNILDEKLMQDLEAELKSVLDELAPLLKESESKKRAAISDAETIREIFRKVEPMLMKSNPESLNFLDDIYAIPGAVALAEHIEEFRFKQALVELSKLKKEWE